MKLNPVLYNTFKFQLANPLILVRLIETDDELYPVDLLFYVFSLPLLYFRVIDKFVSTPFKGGVYFNKKSEEHTSPVNEYPNIYGLLSTYELW